MEILKQYPELAKQLESLCRTRRDEILSNMVQTDQSYKELCRKRAETSMALKDALDRVKADTLFEMYADAVYAQEVYELDAIYKQALFDVLEVFKKQGFL